MRSGTRGNVCIALLVLAASYSAGAPTAARASAHPARKVAVAPVRCKQRNRASGSLTVADNFYTASLSPFRLTTLLEPNYMLFDDLFRWDSRGHLFPMMATQIPSTRNGNIRDGGKTIVIRLKQGLRWSNGTEITSADVKFGWQVGMDAASGPQCAGTCDAIVRIDTPDRYTMILHLKSVDPPLLSPSTFVGGNMPPVWPARWPPYWSGDPHAAAVSLAQDPNFTFIGSRFPTDGPYQAVSQQGTQTVLRPMKYYDDMTCGGYLRSITYTGYNNGQTDSSASQIAAALSGEADVGLDYFIADIANLLRDRAAFHVHIEPTFSFEHLELNLDSAYHGQRNPLSDVRVRLALALALNKRALIERAFSADAKAANHIIAWTPWVNTSQLQQPFVDRTITGQWDPLANGGKGAYVAQTGTGSALTDARKLLAETPWKHGFPLDFYTTQKPERLVVMPAIAAQWAKLGVRVNQYSVSGPQLFNSWQQGGLLAHGAFQVALFTDLGGANPDGLASSMQSRYIDRRSTDHNPNLDQNYAGIRDKIIDRGFDQAIHTFDPVARRAGFRAVQREMNQKAYWITLYYIPTISTTDSRISGFVPSAFFSSETWNAYDWKAKGS
jgi:peptide/nickel transport system substrate-binding protein